MESGQKIQSVKEREMQTGMEKLADRVGAVRYIENGMTVALKATDKPYRFTGRSPKGNLRAFKAMNEVKFADVYSQVMLEANDPEAMLALMQENGRREALKVQVA
jgi:hypothetical protein